MANNIDKSMVHLSFLQRENFTKHHSYDDDMLQYEYIKNGDLRSIEASKNIFLSNTVGHLSDDELRNAKYMLVCAATLSTRFAIEGGMEAEEAYNMSDLFIQTADLAKSISEIRKLHDEMIERFTIEVQKAKKQYIYPKKIVLCMDYIYYNLHKTITVDDLAFYVKLNPSYLSILFKKETGESISEFIRKKRIDAAKNMLVLSDYSLNEISEFLAFSSYSHFSSIFQKYTNMTPKEYQKCYFRQNKF